MCTMTVSAIIVKKGDTTVGHIPEGFCQPLKRLRTAAFYRYYCRLPEDHAQLQKERTFQADYKFRVFIIYLDLKRKKRLVRSAIKKQNRNLIS